MFLANETIDSQAAPHLTHLSRSIQGLHQNEETGKWLVCCSLWSFPATGTWRPVLLLGKERGQEGMEGSSWPKRSVLLRSTGMVLEERQGWLWVVESSR